VLTVVGSSEVALWDLSFELLLEVNDSSP